MVEQEVGRRITHKKEICRVNPILLSKQLLPRQPNCLPLLRLLLLAALRSAACASFNPPAAAAPSSETCTDRESNDILGLSLSPPSLSSSPYQHHHRSHLQRALADRPRGRQPSRCSHSCSSNSESRSLSKSRSWAGKAVTVSLLSCVVAALVDVRVGNEGGKSRSVANARPSPCRCGAS
jgi:hypothetical protein